MKIENVEVFRFDVPFKVVFRHASATRDNTQNIIVKVSCDDKVGFGEGCPRHYVTHETTETAKSFILNNAASISEEVSSISTLRSWIKNNENEIDKNPAAFCALEIAILDLVGQIENKSLEQVLCLSKLTDSFNYSAVLGDSPLPVFAWQMFRYRRQKFLNFKVKLSGKLGRDRRKINALKTFSPPNVHIRLDANNLWVSPEECISHIKELQHQIFAIEEPLEAGNISGFKKVSEACKTPIILDESFLRSDQIDDFDDANKWIINLRVSKMGGMIRSLDVAQRAMNKGIGIIVGAQVGETSILTRAGLTIAHLCRPKLIASEGAFGTHLLKNDLSEPCLMFQETGELDPCKFLEDSRHGLGLQVKEKLLSNLN